MENEEQTESKEIMQQYVSQLKAQIEAEQQLKKMLSLILESDARLRLNTIKSANPKLYMKAVQTLIQLYNLGHIKEKLSDSELKELLAKINEKREITIKRK